MPRTRNSAPSNTPARAPYTLLWGQGSFAVGLLVCFALRPQFLKSEGGFSNYGVTAITVAPFTIAFLAAIISSWRAARLLVEPRRALANMLRLLSILFAAVLVSTYPYKINGVLDTLHQDAALALFAFELGFGVWLTVQSRRFTNIALLCGQLAGTVAGIYTVWGNVHLLFVSQLVVGLSFGALLVVVSRQLVTKPESA